MTTAPEAPQVLTLEPGEVSGLLSEHYGLRVHSLDVMSSELSSVYRLELAGGAELAFKATYFSENDHAATRWRVDAMEALQDAGIPAGHSVRSRSGEVLPALETSAGMASVHVAEWLPGVTLDQVPAEPAVLRAVGGVAARVSSALCSWPAPPVTVTHPWELRRTLQTLKALHAVEAPTRIDPQDRAVLDEAARRFREQVDERLEALPHSVVHHDLHDANLLVDPLRADVSGVLDFGDMVWAPRIAELAVAAAYACRGAEDPVAAYLHVAEGWAGTTPLEEQEVAVLFEASIARLAVNYEVWSARSQGERQEYAKARSQRTMRALRCLIGADVNRVTNELAALLL